MVRPALRRLAVFYLRSHYPVSLRRACKVLKQSRSSQFYRSVKDLRPALRARMREIAGTRVRYGYRRVHVLLRREGWEHDAHTTYRLYQEERLQLRSMLPRRRKMVVQRRETYRPSRPNQAWSMDFVADQLADRSKTRLLTIVDVFTRESVAIEVGKSLKAEDVLCTLGRVIRQRSAPVRLFVDNSSEFSGRMLDYWAYHHKAVIDFSRPGKPTDNAFIESFNGSLRDECHGRELLGQS